MINQSKLSEVLEFVSDPGFMAKNTILIFIYFIFKFCLIYLLLFTEIVKKIIHLGFAVMQKPYWRWVLRVINVFSNYPTLVARLNS